MKYTEETPEIIQGKIIETFKELIKEARDEGDWERYGMIFVLIGHHGIDPNNLLS